MKKLLTLLALTISFSMNAQEIQEVFPELVCENDNEMLAVNYQGLVPVLINAFKEQDKIIKSQEARLTNIENLLAKLNE